MQSLSFNSLVIWWIFVSAALKKATCRIRIQFHQFGFRYSSFSTYCKSSWFTNIPILWPTFSVKLRRLPIHMSSTQLALLHCIIFSSVSHSAPAILGNGNIVVSWCMEMTHMIVVKPLQLLSKWDLCCLLHLVYVRITGLVMTHQMGPRWIETVSP